MQRDKQPYFKDKKGKGSKGWKADNGLPFPNFALGKSEIPAVCKCVYDGTKFYVTNHLDMHTLYHNGSFGTSSLTFRGLSRDDSSFSRRPYYKKKLSRQTFASELNGSLKIHNQPSTFNCFRSEKGKRVRINVEPSSSGPELFVHLSSESGNCSSSDQSCVPSPISSRFETSNSNHRINVDCDMDSSDGPCTEEKSKLASQIDAHVIEEEKLILMPEEAIFLSFGVGCLAIYNLQGEAMDYRECWKNLVTLDSDFPTQYAAYHYFRGKNWIPKNGETYGASYVLYEGGPDFSHAQYIVYVLESRKPKPTWLELAACQRLATHVSKQVLLCEVSVPEAFRPDASEPRSVFEMKLREMSVSRWTPRSRCDFENS